LKAETLAGKCQERFMTVIFAFHAGKAFVWVAAVAIAIDDLLPRPLLQHINIYGVSERMNWKGRTDERTLAYDMSFKE
jgi:hypothetical protein